MRMTAVLRNTQQIHCVQMFLPLQEMEEFVQSSEDDGIVVFSLGSMISNITREKSDMMAAALAQIPQKVETSKTIAWNSFPIVLFLICITRWFCCWQRLPSAVNLCQNQTVTNILDLFLI